MTVAANLISPTVAVDPGDSAGCGLEVRNNGTVVDQFAVDLVGAATEWATARPATINLMPGASATVELTFTPPRSSALPAGTVPFGVRVRSREDPGATVVEEGEVEIRPFSAMTAEIVPAHRRGRRKGRYRLAVENTGNQPVPVDLSVSDVDAEVLDVRVESDFIVAAPGTVTLVKVVAVAHKRFLRGEPRQHQFQLAVAAGQDEPIACGAVLVQQRVLPKWLLPALLALAALAVVLVTLWFTVVQHAVKSIATDHVSPAVEQANQAASQAKDAAGRADSVANGSGGTNGGAAKPGAGTGGSGAGPGAVVAGQPGTAPIGFRIAAQAKPVTDNSYQRFTYSAPAGRGLALTDMVLQNPRGDTGYLRVTLGDQVVLESGLANFRDLDYHYVNPLYVDKGKQVIVEVNCVTPGPGTPVCTPSVSFSGLSTG